MAQSNQLGYAVPAKVAPAFCVTGNVGQHALVFIEPNGVLAQTGLNGGLGDSHVFLLGGASLLPYWSDSKSSDWLDYGKTGGAYAHFFHRW